MVDFFGYKKTSARNLIYCVNLDPYGNVGRMVKFKTLSWAEYVARIEVRISFKILT